MRRLLALGITCGLLWSAPAALAKRDDGSEREKRERRNCLLVVERAAGDIRLLCER